MPSAPPATNVRRKIHNAQKVKGGRCAVNSLTQKNTAPATLAYMNALTAREAEREGWENRQSAATATALHSAGFSHERVLMDTWYATKALMGHIEHLQKTYYCPLKTNRLVDDSFAANPYQRIDALPWTQRERVTGKRIKIKGFPQDHKVKLFRVVSSSRRTEYVVTNDRAQTNRSVVQQACHGCWKIEQLHRQAKQVTGLEKSQCRLERMVRNHIGCALLVWGATSARRPSDRANHLSGQTWVVDRLFETTTQKPIRENDTCVSPIECLIHQGIVSISTSPQSASSSPQSTALPPASAPVPTQRARGRRAIS